MVAEPSDRHNSFGEALTGCECLAFGWSGVSSRIVRPSHPLHNDCREWAFLFLAPDQLQEPLVLVAAVPVFATFGDLRTVNAALPHSFPIPCSSGRHLSNEDSPAATSPHLNADPAVTSGRLSVFQSVDSYSLGSFQ